MNDKKMEMREDFSDTDIHIESLKKEENKMLLN